MNFSFGRFLLFLKMVIEPSFHFVTIPNLNFKCIEHQKGNLWSILNHFNVKSFSSMFPLETVGHCFVSCCLQPIHTGCGGSQIEGRCVGECNKAASMCLVPFLVSWGRLYRLPCLIIDSVVEILSWSYTEFTIDLFSWICVWC